MTNILSYNTITTIKVQNISTTPKVPHALYYNLLLLLPASDNWSDFYPYNFAFSGFSHLLCKYWEVGFLSHLLKWMLKLYKYQIILQNGCTTLSVIYGSSSCYPSFQQLELSWFEKHFKHFIRSCSGISLGVLTDISLRTNNVKHFFLCLFSNGLL